MKLVLSAILPKIKHVRWYSNYLEKLSKSSFVDLSNIIEQLPAKVRSKIIFSSYLEDQVPRLGYKRNQGIRHIIKIKEQAAKYEDASARPLAASLKYLDVDTSLEAEAPLVEERPKTEDIAKIRKYINTPTVPDNWLQDYEYYDENDETPSPQGTPDPTIPPSNIPCNGCGAHLQCAHPSLTGYLPSEIFKGRTNDQLKTIICQRCHFLKEYNVALDVEVEAEQYVNILSSIKDKFALVVLIIDLLDFPCSIWPKIQDILGNNRPVFIVGNKVDLLPKDSKNYLEHIKKCLLESVINVGLIKMNIKHVHLISAKTGYGIEELITQLHSIWKNSGDVYLVGCTNVGKSTLFNALLRSDYCKVQAINLVQKATACPWPGTTLNMLKFPILNPSHFRVFQRSQRLQSQQAQKYAEAKLRRDQLRETKKVQHATLIGHIGRTFVKDEEALDLFAMSKGANPILTLNEKNKEFVNSKWCYDTPGVMHPEQIHHLLTTEELLKVMPTGMIAPRVFKLTPGLALFLGGLGRLDFVSGEVDSMRISIYSSHEIPVLITQIEHADEMYTEMLGSEVLGVPMGDADRINRWPDLKSAVIDITGESYDAATCDILLSSAGWIGIKLPVGKTATFRAWTPEGRGIFMRKPPLVPFGEKLRGQKRRGCLAYRVGKPFIVT